jgi:hypothetical protein
MGMDGEGLGFEVDARHRFYLVAGVRHHHPRKPGDQDSSFGETRR